MNVVTSSRSGQVARITISRPERRNALHQGALEELHDAVRSARLDEVRAVVLTGDADHFCSGADLTELEDLAFTRALRSMLDDLAALPVPPVPPPGLPSTLLERRPDLRQAEQSLAAATALIGVAKAQQYPSFSLTGFLGAQSADLVDVLRSGGRVASIGASVFWPVLDAGRYAARTREAEARAEQAAAAYERAVHAAWREVADALDGLAAATQSQADVEARLLAARDALRFARLRYDAGYSGYLEVLDAQRTLNAAELGAIQNRQARLAASVDLMKSLGGGWTPPEAAAAAFPP